LTIEINVISDNDSSNTKLNLNINNIYNLVNDNSSITDFGENDASNSEAVLLLSESRGRGRRRGCGHDHPQIKMLKKINKPKLIWIQTLHTSIIHA
jgi:hypothetical protein